MVRSTWNSRLEHQLRQLAQRNTLTSQRDTLLGRTDQLLNELPMTASLFFTAATALSSTMSFNTSAIMFLPARSYTENRTDPQSPPTGRSWCPGWDEQVYGFLDLHGRVVRVALKISLFVLRGTVA
jgi:hypothetical protein